MADLSSFHSSVATHVPTAPTPTLDEAIRSAAIDFCTATSLIVETVQADAEVGESVVYFTLSSDQLAIRYINAVWYQSAMLAPVSETRIYTPTAFVAETAQQGPSAYHYAAESNYITVYPTPAEDVTDAFTARVVVVPTRDATTVPDALYNEWLTTIAAGARAYIKSIPGQPFTGDATRDLRLFHSGIQHAMAQALKGRVGANLAVRAGRAGPRAVFAKRY